MAVYLDCAATTPLDPRVRSLVGRYLDEEFGNAGSRTHEYGLRARRAVEQARQQVAAVVHASRGDVIFTSGATESNNLAILGLQGGSERATASTSDRDRGREGRGHVVTTAIEHHAVLEPVHQWERRGGTATFVSPDAAGCVDAAAVLAAIRPDTRLVSVMHVNNETGALQPIAEIAAALKNRVDAADVFFHVDAAQGFGKDLTPLRHPRIDLISISGHKIGAPKGVGALIARRRGSRELPLSPLMFGGGQERGVRPGTLPVALIAGLGLAAELSVDEWSARDARCRAFREALLTGLSPLAPIVNGACTDASVVGPFVTDDTARGVPNIVNVSIPGIESEAAIEAWRDLVAISNGAACTSQSYTCSHVLSAMGVDARRSEGALRFSWTHESILPDLPRMVEAIERLRVEARVRVG